MIDYSFIQLKDNFTDAKDIGDSPVVTHGYYDCIQLLPNESYLQLTNVIGGLSFQGDYKVEVIDCNETVLADVTNNVFIEEFTDSYGSNQLKIEFVNLTVDFYRQTIFFKFSHTISDVVYYSNPLNITSFESEQTAYFQYKNYNDFQAIPYTNAQCYQSIRVKTYFDIPIDESEMEDYYQISTQNTISSRVLIKRKERYQIDYIHRFAYDRLNLVLKHDLVYLDGVRLTSKTNIDSSEREGQSNFMQTGFEVSKDYNDRLSYDYQVFAGIELLSFTPSGIYTLAGLPTTLSATFNNDITIGTGTLTIYDSNNSVVQTFTQADMSLNGTDTFEIDITGVITSNDDYYVLMDSGLVAVLGIDYEGIDSSTTWNFTVQNADFLNTDFSGTDFLTN